MTDHSKPTHGHYRRSDSLNAAVVPPLAPLPPRHLLEGHKDALAAYDVMVELNAQIQHHNREAVAQTEQAARAAIDYKSAVRDALAAGKDPGKIKNAQPEHAARAEAHREFAADAKRAATAQGHKLGPLLAEAAPDVFPALDAVLEEASREVLATLDAVTAHWAEWSRAWSARQYLSRAAYRGGTLHGGHLSATQGVPAEVGAAVAAIKAVLDGPRTLTEDEAALSAWRRREADARAVIDREVAQRERAIEASKRQPTNA